VDDEQLNHAVIVHRHCAVVASQHALSLVIHTVSIGFDLN